MLVTISANPVQRVKRGYEYEPPADEPTGLFEVSDNEIPDDDGGDDGSSISVSAQSPDGNSFATASVSNDGGSASSLSNAFEFEKPVYDPKCCASCTCTGP